MSASEERNDLISVIVADHREVERAFTELESGNGDPRHRRDLVDHVIAELVRHSVAEEQFLYPAARTHLADGDEVADHEIAEHAEVERLMKELENVDPNDPRFDELLSTLIRDVRHHVEEEENDLLPRLGAVCDPMELLELGDKVQRAKKIAPTRPHPSAPTKPPANRIVAPGAGLIDRLRDLISGRTT